MGTSYILATDPRGMPVEFSDIRWDWITTKHPDLLTYKITALHLKRAIEKPADGCIFSSKNYDRCSLYYIRISAQLQMRVVVKFENNIGEILTAHFLKERSSGEAMEWMEGQK
jgi:hypothetical protein